MDKSLQPMGAYVMRRPVTVETAVRVYRSAPNRIDLQVRVSPMHGKAIATIAGAYLTPAMCRELADALNAAADDAQTRALAMLIDPRFVEVQS